MTRDVVKKIRKATKKKCSAEEKICIVLEALRGEKKYWKNENN
jgi:hypothetical protein